MNKDGTAGILISQNRKNDFMHRTNDKNEKKGLLKIQFI